MAHTKTPWFLALSENAFPFILKTDLPMGELGYQPEDAEVIDAQICDMRGGDDAYANARLIVRAVNSFEAMRDACKQILNWYEVDSTEFNREMAIAAIRAALAVADKDEK